MVLIGVDSFFELCGTYYKEINLSILSRYLQQQILGSSKKCLLNNKNENIHTVKQQQPPNKLPCKIRKDLKWAWTKMVALVALFISSVLFVSGSNAVYYGAKINDFANRFHNIKGEVYAVDSRTIFIKVRSE